MNPKYMPTDPVGRRARLGEEIGEVMIEAGHVMQLLGKAGRFGIDSRPPLGPLSNRDLLLARFSKLRIEMDDLTQAMMLVEDDLLDARDVAA
ncbi:hypothetical protein [Methylobacterium sp. WL120]|uniref:hypothetical protein n=1 Tax=Methylobacterium sp. WL120 TaxID=2603887 RepID=UPI0011CB80B3|nr:hypothetical protein [Methylobacterium sp. WL120]TXM69618.1 hypothetical protein FV229_04555 [Methylobacterium sp. WL120]